MVFTRTNGKREGARVAGRLLPLCVALLTLMVFGAALAVVIAHLRLELRNQIISRDGDVLNAAALIQHSAEDVSGKGRLLDESPLDHLASILRTSKLRPSVRGFRLFDVHGQMITGEPATLRDATLPRDTLEELQETRRPVGTFQAEVAWEDLIPPLPGWTIKNRQHGPLLQAAIPVLSRDGQRFLGAAEFLLDGQGVEAELATLDEHLVLHATLVFCGGGAVMLLALLWAFWRLQWANDQLAERTASLLRANHELALAAKTSALGAVTAHLVHGLKNPLFGLQNFMRQRIEENGDEVDEEWQAVAKTTQRMQSLVNEVVRVLREQEQAGLYEITLEEVADLLMAKLKGLLLEHQVSLRIESPVPASFTNREANLILLILENLIQNSVQVSRPGDTVKLLFNEAAGGLACAVCDTGPGFSAAARARLFTPANSTKQWGSGLGLAISKQLANHLGASLELTSSTPSGSVFTLTLPPSLMLLGADLANDSTSTAA
ncbi:MAG TPA: HAMP domain-containing sensor histidine kinase [Verrucomicrobiae bacterium]|nr:HAMP domain-containing sensor histidine kinase [Verrucomicrobiae bacterium]